MGIYQQPAQGRATGATPSATAPGAPVAQTYIVETLGCANCHGPELRFPRQVLGRDATEIDFQHFAKVIRRARRAVSRRPHGKLQPEARAGEHAARPGTGS